MMNRPLIRVACGVLVDASGRVLTAQRPAGKLAAGLWEFPGGKIEPGESPLQALCRELHEELGISVTAAEPLLRFRHDYSDRCVILDTWKVTAWAGEPEPREQQAFAWLAPAQLATLDALPTVAPIVSALRLPPHYVFTPPGAVIETLLEGLPALPRGALLRLRQPALSDADYAARAARLLPAAHALGLRVLLDRDPALSAALAADGWHADGRALARHRGRPLPPEFLVAASVHDAAQLAAAQALAADLAVLGPVLATGSHPDAETLGWSGFAALRGDAPLPVLALGGLGPADLAAARTHGAQGVAGISAYWTV